MAHGMAHLGILLGTAWMIIALLPARNPDYPKWVDKLLLIGAGLAFGAGLVGLWL